LIWLHKEMTWRAPHDGSPGRPAVFSDAAIQFCLTIKILFKLPLRQTTGMVASVLKMANLDWAVPDYTTLCRRQKILAVQIPYRRVDGPLNLLVDSTGIKVLGVGEWQAGKHGVQGRRQSLPSHGLLANRERGRKVHLAMDTATSDIRAVEFASCSDGDSPVLPELLDQIPDGEDALAGSLEPVAPNWLDLKAFGERIAARHPNSQTARPPDRQTARPPDRQTARPPDRRNPGPRRTRQPLFSPQHSQDRSGGLMMTGKGAILPQRSCTQQRQVAPVLLG
jgi:Transposase DDE domain